MASFAVARALTLIRSHLYIFVFISIALRLTKEIIGMIYVLSIISSRSFIVFFLILKSLSHFEFIFVCGVRMCSNFTDLNAAVQLSQYHLLKRLPFPPSYILASFIED